MVVMSINNLHPDSVSISVVASGLEKALVEILDGVGVVVPHKVSEIEYVVQSEVARFFKDYHLEHKNVQTELIFDQDIVEVVVSRKSRGLTEKLFTISASRWKKRQKSS